MALTDIGNSGEEIVVYISLRVGLGLSGGGGWTDYEKFSFRSIEIETPERCPY